MDACATTRASGVLKVKTISKCVVAVRLHSVCTRRGFTLVRSPFTKGSGPKGEIGPRGELGRYLV